LRPLPCCSIICQNIIFSQICFVNKKNCCFQNHINFRFGISKDDTICYDKLVKESETAKQSLLAMKNRIRGKELFVFFFKSDQISKQISTKNEINKEVENLMENFEYIFLEVRRKKKILWNVF